MCLYVTLVCCGRAVGWIKMPLTTEVGLDLGDTVLDEDRAPPLPPTKMGTAPPTFWLMSCKRSPILATAELMNQQELGGC